jgi:hypothetical protein
VSDLVSPPYPHSSHSFAALTTIMVPPTTIINLFALISLFVLLLSIRDYRRRRGLLFPPGPRPLPLIGNLLDVPNKFSWLTYTELSRKYGAIPLLSPLFIYLFTIELVGDIISLHVFGKVIIVLNTTKSAKDLLDKRGDIYSDRSTVQIFEM